MKENYICPKPMRWNEIFDALCKAYEQQTGIRLPNDAVSIREAGGPPTPQILNGWVFSGNREKASRWSETLGWAEEHGLLHLTTVAEEDRYGSAPKEQEIVGLQGGFSEL